MRPDGLVGSVAGTGDGGLIAAPLAFGQHNVLTLICGFTPREVIV
jgi:hypothetical protein